MKILIAFGLLSLVASQDPPGTAPTAAEILAENINGQTVHEFRGYYKREHSLIKPYTGEEPTTERCKLLNFLKRY